MALYLYHSCRLIPGISALNLSTSVWSPVLEKDVSGNRQTVRNTYLFHVKQKLTGAVLLVFKIELALCHDCDSLRLEQARSSAG